MNQKNYVSPACKRLGIYPRYTLMGMSADEISYGGNASEHGITEGDAKDRSLDPSQSETDLWEQGLW